LRDRFEALSRATAQIITISGFHGGLLEDQPERVEFTGQDDYHDYGWAKAVHEDDAGQTLKLRRERTSLESDVSEAQDTGEEVAEGMENHRWDNGPANGKGRGHHETTEDLRGGNCQFAERNDVHQPKHHGSKRDGGIKAEPGGQWGQKSRPVDELFGERRQNDTSKTEDREGGQAPRPPIAPSEEFGGDLRWRRRMDSERLSSQEPKRDHGSNN